MADPPGDPGGSSRRQGPPRGGGRVYHVYLVDVDKLARGPLLAIDFRRYGACASLVRGVWVSRLDAGGPTHVPLKRNSTLN